MSGWEVLYFSKHTALGLVLLYFGWFTYKATISSSLDSRQFQARSPNGEGTFVKQVTRKFSLRKVTKTSQDVVQ